MPQEAPAVQNWRLLIVACVLGLVVMVVYNVHINKVRNENKDVMVTVFRYDRTIEVGSKVTDDDLIRVKMPRRTAERIGRLLAQDEKDTLAVNRQINQDVSKNDFAMTGHFTNIGQDGEALLLAAGKVLRTIPVDPKKSPGSVLRIGNYVNVLGMLPTKGGGAYKTYRMIEKLKVVAIGGKGDRGGRSGSTEKGSRTYNSITVEMKCKDPDVSLQWTNLETYLRGPAIIEICSPKSHSNIPPGTIVPELAEFTKVSAGLAEGGGYESVGDGNY
jgi:hypothetical protein